MRLRREDDGSVAPGLPDGVRLLGGADLARLTELEHELFGRSAWSEQMLRAELTGQGRWYVGVEASRPAAPGPVGAPAAHPVAELVGYAGLWFDGDVAQVMTLGVTSRAQRRGVGRVLLSALVDRARELGATGVLLEVRVDNTPALRLYESFGFTVLRRRLRYYQPEDVDAFVMRLLLGPAPTL